MAGHPTSASTDTAAATFGVFVYWLPGSTRGCEHRTPKSCLSRRLYRGLKRNRLAAVGRRRAALCTGRKGTRRGATDFQATESSQLGAEHTTIAAAGMNKEPFAPLRQFVE